MAPIPFALPSPARTAVTSSPVQAPPGIKYIRYNKRRAPRHPLSVRFPSHERLRRGLAENSRKDSRDETKVDSGCKDSSVAGDEAAMGPSAKAKFMEACKLVSAEAKFKKACKTEKFKTVRWSGKVSVVLFEE